MSIQAPSSTEAPPCILPRRDRPPCAGCGYTPQRAYQDRTKYRSQLALDFVGRDIATWTIGADTLLKDSSAAQGGNEVDTLRFLRRKAPELPTPDVKATWETGGRRYIVQDRVPGQTLGAVWHELDLSAKVRILDQVVAVIERWRTFTSGKMSSVTGGPVESLRWWSTGFTPWGPFRRKRELFAYFEAAMGDCPEVVRHMLWRNMPDCRPWTFSHGDLHVYNIMVEDGNLSGIIDFATAGFYPVWWEYVQLRLACGAKPDHKWKHMLQLRMKDSCHEAEGAMRWAKVCDELAFLPDGVTNAAVAWLREQFPNERLRRYEAIADVRPGNDQNEGGELQRGDGLTAKPESKTTATKAYLARWRAKLTTRHGCWR
ncbi:Putative pectate lyase C [Verticillium dahliae VDG2]|nr:Putative pectate lyase C [Verticillium dahliae VDG2]